jgi:hypothetical protein
VGEGGGNGDGGGLKRSRDRGDSVDSVDKRHEKEGGV